MTEEGKEIINAVQEMMLDLKKELKEEITSVKKELSVRLDNVESQVSSVNEALSVRLDNVESQVSSVNKELSVKLDNVESQVSSIKIILENEIRPNIQLLVEGHKQNAEKLDRLEFIAEDVEYIKLKTDVFEAVTKVHAYDISHLKKIK